MGRRRTEDPMDVDDTEEDDVSEASEDDEEDSEEVKSLKVSFFFVGGTRQLIVFSVSGSSEIFKEPPSISQARKCCRQFITTSTPFQSSCIDSRVPLTIIPGYTVLVVDTPLILVDDLFTHWKSPLDHHYSSPGHNGTRRPLCKHFPARRSSGYSHVIHFIPHLISKSIASSWWKRFGSASGLGA